MADFVRITDVSPRDGLQNERGVIPTAEKVRLIQLLEKTGVDEVEITSFVSPKWVPQLGDASELVTRLLGLRAERPSRDAPEFSVLIPNEKGLQTLNAVEQSFAGDPLVSKVSVFSAASEAFSQRNTNGTIKDVLLRIESVVRAERCAQRVRGYISCAIACPFEGPIEPARVVDVADKLIALGVHEIDLGDTIGAATPETTTRLLDAYRTRFGAHSFGVDRLTLHFHDTFGRAAECVRAALDAGVRSFDGSVAGLGGCPYAGTPEQPAPGNIATETLVRTIHEAGFETNVDLEALSDAAAYARQIVTRARAEAARFSTPPTNA